MAKLQIPICISGQVQKLPPIDFCQDGAKYFIHTPFGLGVRLKGQNAHVDKELELASTLTVLSTVCGYWRHGPECSYIEVYYVGPATEFGTKVEKGFGG
jgi:hypothetical protein